VVEGQELRTYLLNLDEFQETFHKLERRLRVGAGGGTYWRTSICASTPKTEFQEEAKPPAGLRGHQRKRPETR